jgi:hypothetical protein
MSTGVIAVHRLDRGLELEAAGGIPNDAARFSSASPSRIRSRDHRVGS